MKRRKFQIILVGCLLTLITVWMLLPVREGASDEHRYQQMLHANVLGWRLSSVEKWLPGPLVRLLRIANLKKSYLGKAQAQAEALLASGYLTNTVITITNLSNISTNERSSQAEVQRRLRIGVPGIGFFSFYVENNQAIITCRSNDLALIRRAIESP